MNSGSLTGNRKKRQLPELAMVLSIASVSGEAIGSAIVPVFSQVTQDPPLELHTFQPTVCEPTNNQIQVTSNVTFSTALHRSTISHLVKLGLVFKL